MPDHRPYADPLAGGPPAPGMPFPPAARIPQPPPAVPIDPHRYRKVRRFIVRVFLQMIWWDVILNQPPTRWLRRDPLPRWREIARRYRALAVEMGGVLIKLGQFLSSRVDVLPPEITGELAGLQDEVPPEPFAGVVARVEADFGRPLGSLFEAFSTEPVGSASLAQVHRARLAGGREVVVKVLRPGIEILVETDLAAVELALSWLRRSRQVRRRVDLERLAAEFAATTRRELDLTAEAAHIERFAELFADDPGVAVPGVFPEASALHTLTLEDVGYIKIADRAGLEAAGIEPSEVARKVYRTYMQQLFVHNFVHADPHPGNLFVEPLPTAAERAAGIERFAPGQPVPHAAGRPFRLVFVDFGMMATIPPRLRGALRGYLIALGTRDAAGIVRAYAQAGVLLPGADLKRLEELHEVLFDRFWGIRLGEIRGVAFAEASFFFRRYRDLLYQVPFQVPTDLLFTGRAVGLLAGLATRLDPDFDPWAETIPFAARVAAEEVERDWRTVFAALARQARHLLELPQGLAQVLTRAGEGRLTVQTSLAPDARAGLERLERTGRRLVWIVTAVGLLVAGTELATAGAGWAGRILLAGAAAAFLLGLLRHR